MGFRGLFYELVGRVWEFRGYGGRQPMNLGFCRRQVSAMLDRYATDSIAGKSCPNSRRTDCYKSLCSNTLHRARSLLHSINARQKLDNQRKKPPEVDRYHLCERKCQVCILARFRAIGFHKIQTLGRLHRLNSRNRTWHPRPPPHAPDPSSRTSYWL